MSLDYMNNKDSKFKALGCFIFGGSATIGTLQAGYNVDKILEMTDNMATELNGYHFAKNFNNIPIVTPTEWENDEYFEKLKNENYDLLFSNCPCSSLSQINKNASVDGKNNVQFYRVFNVIKKVKPKTFFIENAPTLVKLGYPILQDMVNQLNNEYKFSIIRDYGGNHGVPMKRMRTLVIGYRNDILENGNIPLLYMNHMPKTTTRDTIGTLYDVQVGSDKVYNHTLVEYDWSKYEYLFEHIDPGKTAMLSFIDKFDLIKNNINDEKLIKEINKTKQKLDNGQKIWNKTPYRMKEEDLCPSMTSVTLLVHPKHNRSFTIREYACLMGYPMDFKFYPEECKTDIIQCIAQGVPAPFVKYVTSEIKEFLSGNRDYAKDSNDKALCFQHHTHKKYKCFSLEEINEMKELESDKTFEKLEK